MIVAVGMNSIKEKMINLRRLKSSGYQHQNSEPILAYYKEQGLLNTIDGAREIDAVFADVQKSLKNSTIARSRLALCSYSCQVQ